MKRKDLIKKLTGSGCVLVRHGGRHDFTKIHPQGKSSLFHGIMK